MVEPVQPGSSPRLDNDAILSVVCDVPVDSEAPMVTSSISRFAGPTQFFGGVHRGRVCVRAFIRVTSEVLIGVECVRVFIGMSVCSFIAKKKTDHIYMLIWVYTSDCSLRTLAVVSVEDLH